MERLTSLANSHSQAVERVQSLEAQLEKSASKRASLEAKELKAKEDATLVSVQINVYSVIQCCACLFGRTTRAFHRNVLFVTFPSR